MSHNLYKSLFHAYLIAYPIFCSKKPSLKPEENQYIQKIGMFLLAAILTAIISVHIKYALTKIFQKFLSQTYRRCRPAANVHRGARREQEFDYYLREGLACISTPSKILLRSAYSVVCSATREECDVVRPATTKTAQIAIPASPQSDKG